MNTEDILKTSMTALYDAVEASDASAVKAVGKQVNEALEGHCTSLKRELANKLGVELAEVVPWSFDEWEDLAEECQLRYWEYVKVMHRAIELTLGKDAVDQTKAINCARILIDTMAKVGDMGEYIDGRCDYWLDTIPPHGPPMLVLQGYCTQVDLGGEGWFEWERYDQMWTAIATRQGGEPVHRVLERCVFAFAAIYEWHPYTGKGLEFLHMTMGHLIDMTYDEDKYASVGEAITGELLDINDYYRAGTNLRMPQDLVIGQTFTQMYDVRKACEIVAPYADVDTDAVTMQVAFQCINEEKKRFCKGLWRKLWLVWASTSRLWKMLGERQGGPSGSFGAAAIDAYDADMGDSAVNDTMEIVSEVVPCAKREWAAARLLRICRAYVPALRARKANPEVAFLSLALHAKRRALAYNERKEGSVGFCLIRRIPHTLARIETLVVTRFGCVQFIDGGVTSR